MLGFGQNAAQELLELVSVSDRHLVVEFPLRTSFGRILRLSSRSGVVHLNEMSLPLLLFQPVLEDGLALFSNEVAEVRFFDLVHFDLAQNLVPGRDQLLVKQS